MLNSFQQADFFFQGIPVSLLLAKKIHPSPWVISFSRPKGKGRTQEKYISYKGRIFYKYFQNVTDTTNSGEGVTTFGVLDRILGNEMSTLSLDTIEDPYIYGALLQLKISLPYPLSLGYAPLDLQTHIYDSEKRLYSIDNETLLKKYPVKTLSDVRKISENLIF